MEDDIFIGESEMFEDVRVSGLEHDFPAVKFINRKSTLIAYFNKFAAPMLGSADRVRVMTSTHFIVFLPSSSICYNKICRYTNKSHYCIAQTAVTGLRNMIPDGVWFRCYRYKGGIAIKRDEPILRTKSD